jgi:hypothetical protein
MAAAGAASRVPGIAFIDRGSGEAIGMCAAPPAPVVRVTADGLRGRSPSSLFQEGRTRIFVVVAADNVTSVLLARVPAQAPAAVDMAIVLAPERDESADEGDLPDVRSDAAPELVTPARQNVYEIGGEPVRHHTPRA